MGTTKEGHESITARAINYTIDTIGYHIRRHQELAYPNDGSMLHCRVLMDKLEHYINQQFTTLYHFLKFKKFIVYAYDITKVCHYQDIENPDNNTSYGEAKINIKFAWGDHTGPIEELNWTYDWIQNMDVYKIDHIDRAAYLKRNQR